MYKRTLRLLKENTDNENKNIPVNKILDRFTPNSNVLKDNLPYILKGEHLPRTKINPFKKTPLRVIYDREDFGSFILPSRRSVIFHKWNFDELFGIKRWRNDSPFVREYLRTDNHLILMFVVGALLTWPLLSYYNTLIHHDTLVRLDLSTMGRFDVEDLI